MSGPQAFAVGMRRVPRLAVRALILRDNRLLVVNAWPDGQSDLWCAPGGGVHAGDGLPANLVREVQEETGLTVGVGEPALVNEFHDPGTGFHQVEVFFRCRILAGTIDDAWTDPEGVVTKRRWVTQDELATLRHKPGLLGHAAWGAGMLYDPLEVIVR
jgi:8-oxo-dGTP diphosphatase